MSAPHDAASAAGGAPRERREEGEGGRLHLISWNVAGFKTTLSFIQKFTEGGLPGWLERHQVDILCLQEVKLSKKEVADTPRACGATVEGYDSFWCFNDGISGQRLGLNGVTTLVRKGLTLAAEASPLRDPSLDGEGRCLMTDHGGFVVFNVYVPNGGGGTRVPYKQRWLRSLRAAMARQREAGKAVILAGDLNMKHRPRDSFWANRGLQIPRLLARLSADAMEAQGATVPPEARELLNHLRIHWPGLRERLRARELKQVSYKNARGEAIPKWRVFAKTLSGGESVILGRPMLSRGEADMAFFVDGVGILEDGTPVFGPAAEAAPHQLIAPGELSMSELAEALEKLAGCPTPLRPQQQLVRFLDEDNDDPGSYIAHMCRDDGMVDAFDHFHPNARGRATCWSQHTNNRYTNVGGRIDYTLVDQQFFAAHVLRGDTELDTGGRSDLDPNTEDAARAACTLAGRWQPVGFDGGGMSDAPQACYDHQFRPPSTGMIYTPPQYSDHIAVTLLMKDSAIPLHLRDPRRKFDAATRRCMPQAAVQSITSFFSRAPGSSTMPPAAPNLPLRSSKRPGDTTEKHPAGGSGPTNKKTKTKGGISRFFSGAAGTGK